MHFTFTVSALTTTGFGDITLPGTIGRLISVVIMIFGVTLFFSLARAVLRPARVHFRCPKCGLLRHDPDAVHCKACGRFVNFPMREMRRHSAGTQKDGLARTLSSATPCQSTLAPLRRPPYYRAQAEYWQAGKTEKGPIDYPAEISRPGHDMGELGAAGGDRMALARSAR